MILLDENISIFWHRSQNENYDLYVNVLCLLIGLSLLTLINICLVSRRSDETKGRAITYHGSVYKRVA